MTIPGRSRELRCVLAPKGSSSVCLHSLRHTRVKDLRSQRLCWECTCKWGHTCDPASTNDLVPVNITAAATVLSSNTLGCSPTVVAHKQTLEVTSTMLNHWQEWNVTETLWNCWNVTKGDELLEMEVNFTLPGCSVNNGRIPVRVVDPAIVPLHQDKRRSKYALVQPMMVVYVLDKDERENSKQNGLMIDDTLDISNSTEENDSTHTVSKRQTRTPSCRLANFTINFADIGLHRVLVPHSYNARHCVGSCSPHVIDRVKNSTNHARLFASAYAKYKIEPRRFLSPPHSPCCIPIEYTSRHLIELRKDGSLSFTKYPNMVATKCGCR